MERQELCPWCRSILLEDLGDFSTRGGGDLDKTMSTPAHALIQHITEKNDGDVYCEPCWRTFLLTNDSLEGVYEAYTHHLQ